MFSLPRRSVAASSRGVDFREPIEIGAVVVFKASINYVGRTSMEVGIRIESEDLKTGLRRHTNSCYFTMVAIGEGASNMVRSQVAGLGDNIINVFPGSDFRGGYGINSHLF